ncbi:tRNA 4-thiouridine(8) synthase ThiI [bacterium]|nr:tRNA 4-thiouridine(8) synthase ThiI [bacterium]|tara:strand:+ start:5603 stop:6787 length:1185 start_codon:yes stop_codon:yes gene_type:complete
MKETAVVHYDDIALKGANRGLFEQILVRNIAHKIQRGKLPLFVEKRWGRITITNNTGSLWVEEYGNILKEILAHTPGIAVFGVGVMVDPDRKEIEKGVIKVVESFSEHFETFRITTTRVDKTYPSTSQEIDRDLGALVLQRFGDTKRVKLKNPGVTIRVEILKKTAYVYIKEAGISGLPVGSSGRAVALLSGGFDSPVAAYMCATRGVEPLLMHFHAYPQTSRAAIEKVEEIAGVLGTVCGQLTLVLVPLLDAQKEIVLTAPEKLRVVLYRRLMMRVAEEWGRQHDAKAIITGESVGQVASQTLENIAAVENAVATLPVLRPLSGMHKREIINRACEIGTHDISLLPYDDTCTVFMPKRPETKARIRDVLEAEKRYDSGKLVAHMLETLEVHKL